MTRKRKSSPKGGPSRMPEPQPSDDDRSPDVHLLVAIAAWVSDDLASSVRSARRAFLENVYLPAVLGGAAPPRLGLVHGIEEARPEHAKAFVAELEPILRSDRGAKEFLLAVAAAPTVVREREQLIGLARKLLAEPDASRREKLQREVDELRDPVRIAAGSAAVLAEVLGPQAGGPCGGERSSFDV
jgi:hypothetical protein